MASAGPRKWRAAIVSRRVDLVVCAALFSVVWFCHAISATWTSTDSRWTIPTALSIIDRHTANLDSYASLIERDQFYAIDCVKDGTQIRPLKSLAECDRGHFYNFYPIGVALLAVPEVFVIRELTHIANSAPWISRRIKNRYRHRLLTGDLVYTHPLVEVIVASLWIGLATIFIYLIARRYLSRTRSVALALVFAFCTPAWSTGSRALWQHGASMLLIAAALVLLEYANGRGNWLVLAGMILAFSVVVRPTSLVVLVGMWLYLLKTYRRQSALFVAGAVPVFVLFAMWSYSVYRYPIAPYYWPSRPGSNSLSLLHGHFLEALAGNLISPGRGLFVYVPLFLLAVLGMTISFRKPEFAQLRPFLIVILVGHWILISTFQDWWAGFAFGPRYFSDLTPIFIYLLIPVIAPSSNKSVLALFCMLAAVSFAIQFRGANRYQAFDWNRTPVSVDRNPQRVWDWSDIAYFR